MFGLSLFLFACGPNAKNDYEEIRRLLDVTEQTIEKTIDFDAKLKACDDAIRILESFLKKHTEGEWVNIAKTALESWKTRREAIVNELESLRSRLSVETERIARRKAFHQHSLSDIETIFFEKRDEHKEGNNIITSDTYNVRMRGSVIGTSIFKLKIIVPGRIAMDTKSVSADDEKTQVIE